MSKLAKIKLELSKILASFSELKTDKAILYWPTDEEIREGLEVYVLDENGEYSEAPDGEYMDEAENTIIVKDGKVESVTPKAEETKEEVTEEVTEEVAAEETPAEEVESPSGAEEAVPDVIEEVRKEINELYEIVDKLVKKVAELDGRLGESNERLEKMSKMSAAMSAEEEIETANADKTNNKKFDAALEGIKAARNLKIN